MNINNIIFKETKFKYGSYIEFTVVNESGTKIGHGELLNFNCMNAKKFEKENPTRSYDITDALKCVNVVDEYKYPKIKNRMKYNPESMKKGHPIFGEIYILKNIVIHKKFRGNGIGTKSMEILIELLRSKNARFIILRPEPIEVEGINEIERIKNRSEPLQRLITFYERLNFAITGKTIATFYGADIIHMILEL